MASPDFHIPSRDTQEQDIVPAAPIERVSSGLGGAARLLEKIKGLLTVPAEAGVVTGRREPTGSEPRSEADIEAFADKVDDNGWVHGSTSGRLPKLTDAMLARGDAARAAGESITGAINETKE